MLYSVRCLDCCSCTDSLFRLMSSRMQPLVNLALDVKKSEPKTVGGSLLSKTFGGNVYRYIPNVQFLKLSLTYAGLDTWNYLYEMINNFPIRLAVLVIEIEDVPCRVELKRLIRLFDSRETTSWMLYDCQLVTIRFYNRKRNVLAKYYQEYAQAVCRRLAMDLSYNRRHEMAQVVFHIDDRYLYNYLHCHGVVVNGVV